jgi:hypothetical protein
MLGGGGAIGGAQQGGGVHPQPPAMAEPALAARTAKAKPPAIAARMDPIRAPISGPPLSVARRGAARAPPAGSPSHRGTFAAWSNSSMQAVYGRFGRLRQARMFHLNTEQLIDYWRSRRGVEAAPRRSAIDPSDVVNLMPRLFMLGRLGAGQYRFRLVGDVIAKLHDRSLRQADFLSLWRTNDRVSLQIALEAVRRRGEPLVIACEGRAQGAEPLSLEILLAPILNAEGEADRFIGLYQPLSPVEALDGEPVFSLGVRAILTPDSEEGAFPRLRLASIHGAATR